MDNKRKNNNIETKMTDICISVIDKTTAPLVGRKLLHSNEGTNAVAQPLDFGSSTRQSVLSGANLDKNDIISKLIAIKKITNSLDNNSFLYKIGECFPDERKREEDKKRVFVIKYQPICIETEEKIIIIRASDHNAVCDNLLERNYTDGKGIVVKPKNSKNTFKDNDNVNFKEYVFFATDNSENKYNKIIDGLVSLIKTGEWDEKVKYDNVNISPKIVVKSDNNLGETRTPIREETLREKEMNDICKQIFEYQDFLYNAGSDFGKFCNLSYDIIYLYQKYKTNFYAWIEETKTDIYGEEYEFDEPDAEWTYHTNYEGEFYNEELVETIVMYWECIFDYYTTIKNNLIRKRKEVTDKICNASKKLKNGETLHLFQLLEPLGFDYSNFSYSDITITKNKKGNFNYTIGFKEKHYYGFDPYSNWAGATKKNASIKQLYDDLFESLKIAKEFFYGLVSTDDMIEMLQNVLTHKLHFAEFFNPPQKIDGFSKKSFETQINSLSLQGIRTKGIPYSYPFQINDILKIKGDDFNGTLLKVYAVGKNYIVTTPINGNKSTSDVFKDEYIQNLEYAKLQHLDMLCEEH